ncbi:hypothetical protein A8L45_08070 [Veronia pacifica]|uniref:Holin n=2 Tax=Veronia pacifica TaxID=1080227 RepID=A0A1C3EL85_9GAMM|nr:hypothetical protein A8L45_08070 [Veronia pacifica]
MEKLTVGVNYSASAATVFAGLTFNEWVALGGLLIGLGTFITNLWYKREHLKLQRKEKGHDAN